MTRRKIVIFIIIIEIVALAFIPKLKKNYSFGGYMFSEVNDCTYNVKYGDSYLDERITVIKENLVSFAGLIYSINLSGYKDHDLYLTTSLEYCPDKDYDNGKEILIVSYFAQAVLVKNSPINLIRIFLINIVLICILYATRRPIYLTITFVDASEQKIIYSRKIANLSFIILCILSLFFTYKYLFL